MSKIFNFKNYYLLNVLYLKKNCLIIIICIFLYVVNKMVIIKYYNGCFSYLFRCYFNDILAGVLMISLINILTVLFFSKKIDSFFQIVIIFLVIGFIWEYTPNLIKKNAISDFFDIVAYEFGGFLYWIIHKKEGKYEKKE